MVNAKDLLYYLCNTLEYRFFSGVPCCDLKEIYNHMDSSIMHYIPATNAKVALGITSGFWLASKVKTCVLLDYNNFVSIIGYILQLKKYDIPCLFVVSYTDSDDLISLKYAKLKIVELLDSCPKLNKHSQFILLVKKDYLE